MTGTHRYEGDSGLTRNYPHRQPAIRMPAEHDGHAPLPDPGGYTIGITGHRALRADITQAVRDFYAEAVRLHGDQTITVMSSLAEGADTLCAELAVARGFRLIVPLPFDLPEYRRDFPEPAAKTLERMLAVADETFTAPVLEQPVGETIQALVLEQPAGKTIQPPAREQPASETIQPPTREQPASETLPNPPRGFYYRQAGLYVASHCDILLAVWDGVERNTPDGAGTWETIKIARQRATPVYIIHTSTEGGRHEPIK